MQIKKIYPTEAQTIDVYIEDVKVKMEPDTGAKVIIIIDDEHLNALQSKCQKTLVIKPSTVELKSLTDCLPVKGEIEVKISNRTCGVRTRIVITEKINSPPLLGKKTLVQLGMIWIDPTGEFAEKNELCVKSTKKTEVQVNSRYKEIMEKYDEVFTGIGRIHDKKNDKPIYATFTMKEDCTPVTQRPRQVAYHLQDPLKKWLQRCVEEDIFEEVPTGEAVTWCSPLVVQPKPRFANTPITKLEPEMLRTSIDLRVPNKYMERNSYTKSHCGGFHTCLPRLQSILSPGPKDGVPPDGTRPSIKSSCHVQYAMG